MVVFGTRPEAIKVAPVLLGLARHPGFEPVVVVSSQHTSLLDPVLEILDIRPDHDLGVGTARQSLAAITTRVLTRLEPLIDRHRPDAVRVQGDTTTTLAGALAAFYDSGGVQEEAPSLGKPVLVLRESTERPEGVAAGAVRLVGTDTAAIVGEARRLLDDPAAYWGMARAVNPYGDGRATSRVLDAMSWAFDGTRRPDDFAPPATGAGACSR
jgi:UDP-N-acetylglucosamine 2-epimerase